MHPDREIRPSVLKKSIEGLLNTEALKQKGSCVVLNAHHAEVKTALVKTNGHDGSHTSKTRNGNGNGKPSKKAAKKASSSPKRKTKKVKKTSPKHRKGHQEQHSTQE